MKVYWYLPQLPCWKASAASAPGTCPDQKSVFHCVAGFNSQESESQLVASITPFPPQKIIKFFHSKKTPMLHPKKNKTKSRCWIQTPVHPEQSVHFQGAAGQQPPCMGTFVCVTPWDSSMVIHAPAQNGITNGLMTVIKNDARTLNHGTFLKK